MLISALFLSAFAGDVAPAAPALPAPPAPEAALFGRVWVVGGEMTEGRGLEKELGAPGSLADIVDATLLFAHSKIEKRTYPSINVAPQQMKAAIDANATLVCALDYLTAFVYSDAGSDEGRRANVEGALKSLESFRGQLVLGNVPDLHSAGTIINPLITAKHMPAVETVTAINERIAAWAAERTNVVIAPVATMFACIDAKQGFGVRISAWPETWLPELLQKDRVHTRMHGTIAAWLLGLDALCLARKDLSPTSFDWSAISIFRKVYAAKDAERRAAAARLTDARRLAPNRPPPGPPPPPPPRLSPEEEMRKKLRGDDEGSDRPARGEKEKKEKGEEEG